MWSHYPKQNLFQTPVEVRVNGSDVLDPGAPFQWRERWSWPGYFLLELCLLSGNHSQSYTSLRGILDDPIKTMCRFPLN